MRVKINIPKCSKNNIEEFYKDICLKILTDLICKIEKHIDEKEKDT